MMRAVLQQFVEWNPSALTKVKSIVIDKDYREWDVLEEIFTESEVLLCQFHVLKWFKHVVTQAKYKLSATKRETVLTILRAMVYAPSEDAFLHQRMLLLQFLGSEHGNLIAYMRDYWYNCTKMWSYAGRGKVFTAANTTTNRLESFWNQYKESLGRKRRIDYCVERIFVHATAVLRREKRLLSDFLTKTKLQPRVPTFLAPLVNDLSEYATDLVVAQYNKYASNSSNYSSVSIGSSEYAVRIVGTRTVVVAVDNQRWECSCSFFKGSSLPCRYLMHVASDIDRRHKYPLEGLSPRWSLTAATSLMDELHQSVEEASNLRSGVWWSGEDVGRGEDDQGVQSDQLDSIDALAAAHQTGERPRRLPAVAFLTVRRGEGRDCDLVMTDHEKINSVEAQFEPIVQFLMVQGADRFRQCAMELDVVLGALLESWRGKRPNSGDTHPPASGDTATAAEKDFASTGMVEEEASATSSVDNREPEDQEVEDNELEDHEDDSPEVVFEEDLDERRSAASHPAHLDATGSPAVTPLVKTERFSPRVFDDIGATESEMMSAISDSVGRATASGAWLQALDDEEMYHILSPVRSTDRIPSSLHSHQWLEQVDKELEAEMAIQFKLDGHDNETDVSANGKTPTNSKIDSGVGQQECRDQDDVNHKAEAAVESEETFDFLLPDVPSAGVRKQSRQLSTVTGKQAVVSQTSECPVTLQAFVEGLGYCRLPVAATAPSGYPQRLTEKPLLHRHVKVGRELVRRHENPLNFVIPPDLPCAIKAAMAAKRKEIGGLEVFRPDAIVGELSAVDSFQLVGRLAGVADLRGFSESEVADLDCFFERAKMLRAYKTDQEWVASTSNWAFEPDDLGEIPLLEREVEAHENCKKPTDTKPLRESILSVLDSSTLETVLSVPVHPWRQTPPSRVSTREILAHLTGRAQLNDAVVNFSLHLFSRQHIDTVVIDSLNRDRLYVPSAKLKDVRVVLFPVNFTDIHWCIICVTLPATSSASAVLYDPMGGSWHPSLLSVWETWCLPLLDAWHKRDQRANNGIVDLSTDDDELGSLGPIALRFLSVPKQMDGTSCALYCILQGLACLNDDSTITNFSSFGPSQVKVMRLRLLWYMLTQATRQNDSARIAAAEETMKRFQAHIANPLVKRRKTT
jgi:hypothetical protein